VLDDIATVPPTDQLVVLSGPRRIGKSVTLLRTAVTLLGRDDVDPRQVILVACDGMTPQDLRRVLVLARAMTTSIDAAAENTPARRVWLFDEIGTIAGWSAVLKYARDNTAFGDDTVVVTGSQWAPDEDIEGHLLAGRAGSGTRRRRAMLPMSFREFVHATSPGLDTSERIHPADLQNSTTRQVFESFAMFVDDLDLAWQAYLTIGGFPRSVAEHAQLGGVTEAFLLDIEAWLHRDIDPAAGPESIPLLLDALQRRSSSPLAVTPTGEHLQYGKGMLERRLARMTRSHALIACPQRDDEGLPVVRTQAKHYLTDPILAWLSSRRRSGLPEPDMTRLTEAVIGCTLARSIDQWDEGRWEHGDTIGYIRTSTGREIDFAPVPVRGAAGASMTVPIESKWVDSGWRGEARTITGKYGRGVVATKTTLDMTGPVWAIPAPLLALVLL
jgi:predicted AAA+ superfamily ATPase